NYSLSSKKTYLTFPSLTLLGKKVNVLGLSTTNERLRALKDLECLKTAVQLERYLGVARYL
ncbi:hypothetical protein BDV96DRAFT_509716, partial [Lophiotrema nucula]